MNKLTFYNLSVKLETTEHRLISLIRTFLNKFYTQKGQKGFSKVQKGADKLFVSKIKDDSTYLFHNNQFIHLYRYLEQLGYTLVLDEKIDMREYNIISGDFKIREGWSPYDYQEPIIDFLLDNPIKSKLVPIQTGKGKDQPLSAKIKVPGGWKSMGEIKVGTIITAWDGTSTKVNGIYPQGKNPVYRITFEDGRNTECGAGHLWKVYCINTSEHNCWRVISTVEVQRLISIPNSRVYIPLIQSEDCLESDIRIDSYLLGSHNQRLKFIQELLNTNATIDKITGYIKISTTSYQLAIDVQYLVRSLGGIATIHTKNSNSIYKDKNEEELTIYDVDIRYHTPSELFTSPGKRELLGDSAKSLKLRVTSIEYIGEKETQCISIDHPDHLYVTDDFIVTHNTSIALFTVGKLNQRLGIVILPNYIEKWINDICTVHKAVTTDIMVVQGSKALRSIIEMARTNSLDNSYYIFSSRTMQEFITQYEEDPQLCVDMYGCAPLELFPLIGIGIMLIDETHQHFHAIFKIIIHTNVKFQIGLSATLMSDDNLITQMHAIVYPDNCIYKGGKLDRYVDVYAISYTISEHFIKFIKTKNYGSSNYSHIAFEQSILRNNNMLQRYIRLIETTVNDYYIDDYKEQDKLIIFVSTIALATYLTNSIKSSYPEFQIQRYVEEDSYEEMLNADIIISTPTSAGTAFDIPRLRVVIQTVSISSTPTNIQNLGRLRKLKDRDVKFCYLYAGNINKQREYHLKRIELFRDRVANIKLQSSRVSL